MASLARQRQSIQEAISGAVLAITLFGGVTFTLMLMAIYGPAASYLCTQAHKRLQQEVQAGKIHEPQQWLKEHQLSITLGEQLPDQRDVGARHYWASRLFIDVRHESAWAIEICVSHDVSLQTFLGNSISAPRTLEAMTTEI